MARAGSSADRAFKGDEETFDAARPDATLDFDRSDRLELPALSSMLVEHVLELVARHFAADHALAELDHCVLVAVRHVMTIVAGGGTSPDVDDLAALSEQIGVLLGLSSARSLPKPCWPIARSPGSAQENVMSLTGSSHR